MSTIVLNTVSKSEYDLIEVNLKTSGCGGRPYFSLTVDAYEKRRNGRLIDVGGGAWNVRQILEETAPTQAQVRLFRAFDALHLSSIEGEPMYAVENGFYYLQNPKEFRGDATLYNHFRCNKQQLERIKDSSSREDLKKILEELDMYTQWKQEADKALELLKNYSE